MAFGILDCKTEGSVPGTAFMSEQADLPEEYQDIPRAFFRYGTGRYANIVLLPQPSDSPNDPLNWPQLQKETILVLLSLNAAVVGAYGPLLSPALRPIAHELGITVPVLAHATAWMLLAMGLSLFVVSPLAKLYGRRPLFLGASLLLVATSLWASLATTYPSLLGARVLGAVGMAPYETLVQCVIGDIYFVHERATRIALWNALLVAGINAGPTLAGYLIESTEATTASASASASAASASGGGGGGGYRWAFGVCTILFGVLALGVGLLVPETAYGRDVLAPVVTLDADGRKGLHMRPRHQINLQGGRAGRAGPGEEREAAAAAADGPPGYQRRYVEISVAETRHTWRQQLRLFHGRFSTSPLWKVFARSIIMLFYPAVMWAFLTYGTEITWLVVFSVINSTIFAAPPYNFTVGQVGLISMSPFVLCTLGYMIAGPLNDYIVLYLTRKNKGVYEPEFRLPLMSVSVVLGIIGFFGFGLTVHYQTHWSGPVLCVGAAYMSLVFASTCVFGYILDCYRKHNAEAFVAINSRNLLAFGMTYVVSPWIQREGPLVIFCILGGVFTCLSALTIPLWIYGKRIRSLTGRHPWLKKMMDD